jgi:hypothetical protein
MASGGGDQEWRFVVPASKQPQNDMPEGNRSQKNHESSELNEPDGDVGRGSRIEATEGDDERVSDQGRPG